MKLANDPTEMYEDNDGRSSLFCELVERRVAEDPLRTILVDGARLISRKELYCDARILGSSLRRMGLKKGAVVAFQLPNWYEACVISLASVLYGFVINPLLLAYRKSELQHILSQTAAEVVFIPEQFHKTNHEELVNEIQPDVPGLRHVVIVRGSTASERSLERLIDQDAELLPVDPAPLDATKMILFTSGSTGRPKGVLHTHKSIQSLIWLCGNFWDFNEDECLLVSSPVGHIGGSIYAFEFPWMWGATAVLMEKWLPDLALEIIEKQGVTFFAGATPFLAALTDLAQERQTQLPTLRRFICGGANVPPELVERAAKQFPACVVSRAYGSSEVPLLCAGIASNEDSYYGAHTDGHLIGDVLIIDKYGIPVPAGSSGAIVARTKQMFAGYLDPADNTGAFTDTGYFRMGDLGRIVDDFYIQIVGREKELIIRNGENVSPLEVENALLRHTDILRAAVVGIPSAKTGEKAVAFVEMRDGSGFDLQAMRRHLDTVGLSQFKYPEQLYCLPQMPLSSVGKILKADLRNKAIGLDGLVA